MVILLILKFQPRLSVLNIYMVSETSITFRSLEDTLQCCLLMFPKFIYPLKYVVAEDITEDQFILKRLNNDFYTSNVMGFIGYGRERLIISSRFTNDDKDYFLQYLLKKVVGFPNIMNLQTDSNKGNHLFSFLIFLFPYYLKNALRKGLYNEYICRRYNDGNVKGVIDVARHIEKNTPFIGNIAYSQREFSYDNSLVELVRHTIEFIKSKPYGNILLAGIKDEVKLVVDATQNYKQCDRQKIIEENKKKTIRHAYYREYRDLQRLCICNIVAEYDGSGLGCDEIMSRIDLDPVLDTVTFPEKTYAIRLTNDDESHIDISAVCRVDGQCVVIGYSYTFAEYANIVKNAIQTLVSGYAPENDGTTVLTHEFINLAELTQNIVTIIVDRAMESGII